jgi:hypothetical protein
MRWPQAIFRFPSAAWTGNGESFSSAIKGLGSGDKLDFSVLEDLLTCGEWVKVLMGFKNNGMLTALKAVGHLTIGETQYPVEWVEDVPEPEGT